MRGPRCNKFLRQLFRALRKQGWTWASTGGGHIKLTAPSGAIVYASSSPSDARSQHNLLANLRRIGGFEEPA